METIQIMQTISFIKTSVAVACGILALLTGCASNQINSGTQELKQKTGAAIDTIGKQVLPITQTTVGTTAHSNVAAAALAKQPVAKRSGTAWYGQRTVAVQSDALLPQVFKEPYLLDFDGYKGGRVPVSVVAERLSRITNIPVRISADVYGGKNVTPTQTATVQPVNGLMPAMPMPMPVGNNKTTSNPTSQVQSMDVTVPSVFTTDLASVSMKWNGSLERFLDHVTGMLNLSWSYRDGVVVIERFITESFDIEGLSGVQDYKLNVAGGTTGSGSFGNTTESIEVHESGKNDALSSLTKTIETLVKPSGGSVTVNDGSGRMIVVASKDVLSRVRGIVQNEVAVLRRQAIIQLDIYSVSSSSSDEYGVDWTGFINDLAKTYSATLTAPASLVSNAAAGLGYTLLKEPGVDATVTPTGLQQNTARRYGGSKVLIEALHKMGDSAKYRPVSLVAKHRQWARKTNLLTTGYLAETTPGVSTATGPGVPGIKAGSVTTGDKFLIQPTILDDGSIDLKFGMSLTDLVGLFNVSSGGQTIQTPEVAGTGDQGTIRLKAGESMVITGMSRQSATSDRNGLAEEIPVALGGSKKRSVKRENFLVVVRAIPL